LELVRINLHWFYLKAISIPVEIVPKSNSRYIPTYRTVRNDYPSTSSWKKSSTNSHFQPRQSPITAYDRLINHSPSYQLHPGSQYRVYESNPLHHSRSSEDLLSSPKDSIRSKKTSIYPPTSNHGFRPDSDFIQPKKSSLNRSYDALDDYPEQKLSYKSSTTANSNEYRVPINVLNCKSDLRRTLSFS
jgi:hypothetical protein